MADRGRFHPSPNYIAGSGTVEGDFTINGALTVLGASSFSGSGEANTASNVGSGAGPFRAKAGVDLEFRSVNGAGSVSVTQNANDITVSGSGLTTGSGLGSGEQVYGYKQGSALRFRSLVAGSNVTLTSGSDSITIASTGGGGGSGETNTASNLGAGEGVFAQKNGVDLEFKSLVAGPNITLTGGGDTIGITGSTPGETNTASNLGAGAGIFAQKNSVDLELKSLIAGPNITLTEGGDTIGITGSAPGETNTASNLGAGEGVFAQKNSVDLELKSLIAGPNITLTGGGDTIGITGSAPGETNTISNVGSGEGVFQAKSGVDFQLRSISAGNDIGITSGTNDITVASQITASSLGSGQHVYAYKTGGDLNFRSLVAGSNVTLTSGSDSITIASTGGGGGASTYFKEFKNAEPPSGNVSATPDVINSNETYKFRSGSTDRTLYFRGSLNPYNSGSLKVTLVWFTETATTGTIRWQTAFERQTSGSVILLNSFDTAGQQTIPDFPTASGTLYYSTGTHTVSQIDNTVSGEMYRLRVRRQSSDLGDTVTGAAHLLYVTIEEQ